eukprot:bmy_11340T0
MLRPRVRPSPRPPVPPHRESSSRPAVQRAPPCAEGPQGLSCGRPPRPPRLLSPSAPHPAPQRRHRP